MGNAGERPRTDTGRKSGCFEMSPQDVKQRHGGLSIHQPTLAEAVGINSRQTTSESHKTTSKTPLIASETPLDTLAQLANGRKNLQKRARSKHITNVLATKLADLNSDLKKSYWNSYYCCETLIQQESSVIGKYCNNRWCLTCNRIRTAKLIHGYSETLNQLKDKRFVTLTVPNVPADRLKVTLLQMQMSFRRIQKTLRMRGTSVVGIRKIEVTYNSIRNDFHPHYHLIISGKNVADDVISEWLRHFPDATRQAQDERPGNDHSVMELFKYFTKIVTKNQIHVAALDVIFNTMYGKRTFQPMGIKKNVTEDVDEIQSIVYNDLEPREAIWNWMDDATDWIDLTSGETLSGYTPSESIKKLVNNC